jgi:hypothetical protein
MGFTICCKLFELRDKYPKSRRLLKQLLWVAFDNEGNIPNDKFTINGYFTKKSILEILHETDMDVKDLDSNIKIRRYYEKSPHTEITFI